MTRGSPTGNAIALLLRPCGLATGLLLPLVSCFGDDPLRSDTSGEWAAFDQTWPTMTVRMLHGDDTTLHAGGSSGYRALANVAVWRTGNDEWEALPEGLGTPAVTALAHFRGELIAAGTGTPLDTLDTGEVIDLVGLAAWRAGAWHQIGETIGVVHALVVYRDRLIVAGHYVEWETGIQHLAAWDGEFWDTLGAEIDGSVRAVHVSDGDLIVAGTFAHIGAERTGNVARWDGSRWWPMNTNLDGELHDLLSFESRLVAVGWFKGPAPTTRFSVALYQNDRWRPVGDLNLMTGGLAAAVWRGKLYVAGIGGVFVWEGVRWRTVLAGRARALTVFDRSLIAGGDFGGRTVARVR